MVDTDFSAGVEVATSFELGVVGAGTKRDGEEWKERSDTIEAEIVLVVCWLDLDRILAVEDSRRGERYNLR